MKFSIINVLSENKGFVDGVWVQGHVGDIISATKRALILEELNSAKLVDGSRCKFAVVEEFTAGGPDYSVKHGLKRLDTPFFDQAGKCILDESFVSRYWFAGVSIPIRIALEYFVCSPSVEIIEPKEPIKQSVYIENGASGAYAVSVVTGKGNKPVKYTSGLSVAEYLYCLRRQSFWSIFKREVEAEYKLAKYYGYTGGMHGFGEQRRVCIPEYAEVVKATMTWISMSRMSAMLL